MLNIFGNPEDGDRACSETLVSVFFILSDHTPEKTVILIFTVANA
jgi:hypothetical protein